MRAIERLKSWDGNLDPDTIAGTIFHAFTIVFARDHRARRGADDELVERWLNKSGVALFEVVSSPWRFQERLLTMWDEGDPPWFGGRAGTTSRSRRWRRRSTGSSSASAATPPAGAGAACTRSSSPTPSARPTRSSGASSTARSRPAGASETVTQNGYLATAPFKGVWGPVYRMLADLGDPARSRWQLTTGQSGHPGSSHYDDMIEGWRTGKTNPVYLEEHEVRAAGGAKRLRIDPD